MNKVLEYINKQESPQKEICNELRSILFEVFPGIDEEMKWGVPSYDKGNYYIVALKNHVNIGFSIKNFPKEELSLLEGQGKTMRHLEIRSLDDIEKEKIEKLLKIVQEKA